MNELGLRPPRAGPALILSLLALFLAYVPLSFYVYAFSDDYAYLVIRAYRAVNPYFLGDGRPLGGLLAHFWFSIIRRVQDAWILRVVGLAYLIVTAWMIYAVAIRNGLSSPLAALIIVVFGSTAPVQNWMVWGVSSWQLPAMVLSVASYFPARTIINANGRTYIPSLLAFAGLTFASLCIYQPFSTCVWSLLLLGYVLNRQSFDDKRILVQLVTFILTLGLFSVIFKLVFLPFVPVERHYRLVTLAPADLPQRLQWFIQTPVMAAFNPGMTYYSRTIGVIAALASLTGIILLQPGWVRIIKVLVLLVTVILMSHFSALVAAPILPTRTQVSIALCGVVIIVLGASGLMACFSVPSHAIRFACIILATTFAGNASFTVLRVNAAPQSEEFRRIRAVLDGTALPNNGKLLVIGVPEGASMAGRYCDPWAMIGCISSQWQFALPNMVRLWMTSRRIDYRNYEIYYVRSESDAVAARFEPDITTYTTPPKDATVIDFRGSLLR